MFNLIAAINELLTTHNTLRGNLIFKRQHKVDIRMAAQALGAKFEGVDLGPVVAIDLMDLRAARSADVAVTVLGRLIHSVCHCEAFKAVGLVQHPKNHPNLIVKVHAKADIMPLIYELGDRVDTPKNDLVVTLKDLDLELDMSAAAVAVDGDVKTYLLGVATGLTDKFPKELVSALVLILRCLIIKVARPDCPIAELCVSTGGDFDGALYLELTHPRAQMGDATKVLFCRMWIHEASLADLKAKLNAVYHEAVARNQSTALILDNIRRTNDQIETVQGQIADLIRRGVFPEDAFTQCARLTSSREIEYRFKVMHEAVMLLKKAQQG